jgi:hypothetical protein
MSDQNYIASLENRVNELEDKMAYLIENNDLMYAKRLIDYSIKFQKHIFEFDFSSKIDENNYIKFHLPRQSGKTMLALKLLTEYKSSLLFVRSLRNKDLILKRCNQKNKSAIEKRIHESSLSSLNGLMLNTDLMIFDLDNCYGSDEFIDTAKNYNTNPFKVFFHIY